MQIPSPTLDDLPSSSLLHGYTKNKAPPAFGWLQENPLNNCISALRHCCSRPSCRNHDNTFAVLLVGQQLFEHFTGDINDRCIGHRSHLRAELWRLDLSIGSVLGLSGVVGVSVVNPVMPTPIAVLLRLARVRWQVGQWLDNHARLRARFHCYAWNA